MWLVVVEVVVVIDLTLHDTLLLLTREAGAGDALMTRFLVRDLRRAYPGKRLLWALPYARVPLVEDHPLVDEVSPLYSCVPEFYPLRFDVSVLHGLFGSERYFSCHLNLHPADHMAARCGIELHDPDMMIRAAPEERAEGERTLAAIRAPGKPLVLLCPRSSTPSRDLSLEQLQGLYKGLKSRGWQPVVIHSDPLPVPDGCPLLYGLSWRQTFGVIACIDACIAVETSLYHLAAGLGVPTLGLWSYCDGFTYSKYYKRWAVLQDHVGINPASSMASMPVEAILAKFEGLTCDL